MSERATVTLRRGLVADLGSLEDALDTLGIVAGDDFVVTRPPSEAPELKAVRDSRTSRDAALANYPRAGTQRHRILVAISRARFHLHAGLTRASLAAILGLPDSSVDARVVELIRGGFVEGSGRQRRTATGSSAEILVLTPKGRDAVVEHEAAA